MESFKRVKLGPNEFAFSQPAFFGVPSLHCNTISKPIFSSGDKKAPASAIFVDAVASRAQSFSREVQRPVAGDGCDSTTTRRTCHFDRVPDELVAEIARCVFAKAQSAADVAGMLVTCRRFSSVCHPAASWSLRASAAIEMLLPADAARWTAAAQRLLLSAAAEGNLEAIYVVGMISFYCLNNHWAGAKLLAQAAEAGHGAAMYSLAIINFHGSGGASDDANPEVGVELSWRAARLGFLPALQELGHCFLDGYGVAQRTSLGQLLLQHAAAGLAEADRWRSAKTKARSAPVSPACAEAGAARVEVLKEGKRNPQSQQQPQQRELRSIGRSRSWPQCLVSCPGGGVSASARARAGARGDCNEACGRGMLRGADAGGARLRGDVTVEGRGNGGARGAGEGKEVREINGRDDAQGEERQMLREAESAQAPSERVADRTMVFSLCSEEEEREEGQEGQMRQGAEGEEDAMGMLLLLEEIAGERGVEGAESKQESELESQGFEACSLSLELSLSPPSPVCESADAIAASAAAAAADALAGILRSYGGVCREDQDSWIDSEDDASDEEGGEEMEEEREEEEREEGSSSPLLSAASFASLAFIRQMLPLTASTAAAAATATAALAVAATSAAAASTAALQLAFPRPQAAHRVHDFLASWHALRSLPVGRRCCGNPACCRPETRENEFRSCVRCGKAKYCSRSCQVADWKFRHSFICCPE
ncbi:unnamed protein product [Closterium sp. NIES-53]